MKAGIIGATGYAGAEIARLLLNHPDIDALYLASESFTGAQFSSIYPNFFKRLDAELLNAAGVIEKSDIVFGALPNGAAENYALAAVKRGIPFIDMSADFRFDDDEETYRAWYGKAYDEAELHKNSIYGLSEIMRNKLKELSEKTAFGKNAPLIIGNPGCYPTCATLAAWPALENGLCKEGAAIIVDAASGITGGGREPKRSFHFPECNDAFSAYGTGAHRHSPEITRNFRNIEERRYKNEERRENEGAPSTPSSRNIIFTPHLAPMNRGILATLYIPLAHPIAVREGGRCLPPSAEALRNLSEIRSLFEDFYKDEQFVRVLPEGLYASTNRVRASNYCDISCHIDTSGSTLIILAAIDNMVKGAAGQAIQNMNIIASRTEH